MTPLKTSVNEISNMNLSSHQNADFEDDKPFEEVN